MKHVKQFNEDLNLSSDQAKHLEPEKEISSGELWRDKNVELKQLVNSVANSYSISPESASKALAQYFSTNHWKA
jgi:hypothetical protein